MKKCAGMNRNVAWFGWTIIALSFCVASGCRHTTSSQPLLSGDEYAVMSAVIRTVFPMRTDSTDGMRRDDTLFISFRTEPGKIYGTLTDTAFGGYRSRVDSTVSLQWFSQNGGWDSLIADFRSVAKDTVPIDLQRLTVPNHIVSFRHSPPYGRKSIFFSRAGFHPRRNEAIVMAEFIEFEGSGSFTLLLRNEANSWKVVEGYGYRGGMVEGFGYFYARPRFTVHQR